MVAPATRIRIFENKYFPVSADKAQVQHFRRPQDADLSLEFRVRIFALPLSREADRFGVLPCWRRVRGVQWDSTFDAARRYLGRRHLQDSNVKPSIPPCPRQAFFCSESCHPEQSASIRKANGRTESKDRSTLNRSQTPWGILKMVPADL